jgi:predicted ATPase
MADRPRQRGSKYLSEKGKRKIETRMRTKGLSVPQLARLCIKEITNEHKYTLSPQTVYDALAFKPKDIPTLTNIFLTLGLAFEEDDSQDEKPQRAARGWLPSPVSRFIPRPKEMAAIGDCVRSARLTTLTGAGGIGKTRLAIAAAQAMAEEFSDGVWFLDLSELQNPAEVPMQVARTLRLTENPNLPPTEEILDFLRAHEALLILDNCEHVLQASARLAAAILECCPDAKILTTSREPLGITGENVWRVPSLDFPQTDARMNPQMLAQFGAVRLLTERASRPQSPLTIDAQNAEAVAHICRCLDGIPLAIELAAVQIARRAYSVQQVVDSLDQALAFLKEGNSVAPSRQQTLRAAIHWSYCLLTDTEQCVFERLGVFVGGFTEEAACQVCGTAPITPESVNRAVRSLADKSLVEVLRSGLGDRYHLLQTIRQFALELLTERRSELSHSIAAEGCNDTETHRCHLHYFTEFTEEAHRHHRGVDHAEWLNRQDREHENCRAALAWALQHGEYETGLRLVGNLAGYLYTRGHHSEAAEKLAAFLECTSINSPARLIGVHWGGNIAFVRADYATARTYFEEGLALRELQGDPLEIAVGRASLATAISGQGNHDEALALFEENLGVFQKRKDLGNEALTWNHIAMIADAREEYLHARDCLVRGLQLFREAKDSANISLAAGNVVGLHIQLGDYAAARPLLTECLELYRMLGTRHRFVYLLLHYLCLAVREQEFDRAAMIAGFAKAFRESIGFVPPPQIAARYQAEEDTVRQYLGELCFEVQATRGAQMSEEEIITFLLKT